MNIRTPPHLIIRRPSLQTRTRRFGVIWYERLMGGINDFAMLFDNISPYAAQRVWVTYFSQSHDRIVWEWEQQNRFVPTDQRQRQVWFDVLKNLFKSWCAAKQISHMMDFTDHNDDLWILQHDVSVSTVDGEDGDSVGSI